MATVLERGDIYFFYRPRVDDEEPHGLADVQRFIIVLGPRDRLLYRLIVVGRKRLPRTTSHQRVWGFVDKVERRPEAVERDLEGETYRTRTRGVRREPAARPAGEGIYAIVEHEGHTHLAYVLELPRRPGEVQRELHIEDEASYIATVRNPEAPGQAGQGLPRRGRAHFAEAIQKRFDERRFVPLSPDLLDYEGAELVLIGASSSVRDELGIELTPEHENATDAAVFQDLHLDQRKHPTRPLFQGAWA